MTELPAYIALSVLLLALPALGPVLIFRMFARTLRRS